MHTTSAIFTEMLSPPTTEAIREAHAIATFPEMMIADATAATSKTINLSLPRRLRYMNDLDRLQLAISNAHATTAGTLQIIGTIKWLKP